MKRILLAVLGPALLLLASPAFAEFHTYAIDEIYSNADGSVQFLVVRETMGSNGENLWRGNPLISTHMGVTKTYVFPNNLPGEMCMGYTCNPAQTAFTRVLIGTQGFAALGLITPDFVVPNGFFPIDGGTINYAGVNQLTYAALPTDGTNALFASAAVKTNVATNFAGDSTTIPGPALVNYSGLWYKSPADSESGWGINFAHQGDVVFASWFTFDVGGKGWWLVMTANNAGENTFSGTLFEATGPAFDSVPFPPQGSPGGITGSAIGTGTLTFADANNATFDYTVKGVHQTKAITRQVFGTLPTCVFSPANNLATAANYTDLWWAAPAASEAGWGVNFSHQGDTIFATWFTFDHDHTPMWLIVTAAKSAPGIYTGALFRNTGGPPFNAVPFPPIGSPGGAMFRQVGTATITFSDGNNAQFSYGIDGVAQTKAITRQVLRAPGTVCH